MKNVFLKIKSLEPKTLLIILLSIVLIFALLFTIKSGVKYPKNEIKRLRYENELLTKKNDSLILVNKNIDKKLRDLDVIIKNNNIKLAEIELELKKLKNKRNETVIYVNRLSATGVARELSKYLDKRAKGKNSR